MRLISSYQIKLTGNLEALEVSIDIYRRVLSYLVPIINHNWDEEIRIVMIIKSVD